VQEIGVGSAVPIFPDPDDPTVYVWRDGEGQPCAYGYRAGGFGWVYIPGLATYRFDETSQIVPFLEDAADPKLVQDALGRTVLPLVLEANGGHVLHASAVRRKDGVVAFCAVSGTGKSTVAYALSRRGYELWGDDAVAVEKRLGCFVTLGLPFELRLRHPSATYFGTSNSPSDRLGTDDSPPLAAVCVLEQREGSPTVERLAPSHAFTAVLAHAYAFDPDDDERKRLLVSNYLDLTSSVPVFRTGFASGLEGLDDVLELLEARVLRPLLGDAS
jgi:hypothetical protein